MHICDRIHNQPISILVTHPELHPLVQHSFVVEFTEQPRWSDAEGAVRLPALSTGHIAKEVIPQLSKKTRAAQ